jgi:hypothetical protein
VGTPLAINAKQYTGVCGQQLNTLSPCLCHTLVAAISFLSCAPISMQQQQRHPPI